MESKNKEQADLTGNYKVVRESVSGQHLSILYKAAGIAAIVQLVCTLSTIIIVSFLGGEPATPIEYFNILQNDRIIGLLRMDYGSLINVALFPLIGFALFATVNRNYRVPAAFGAAIVFLGTAISIAGHSGMSMIHLSDRFAQAASEAERTLILSAGEAVIASDWWHGTGGFMAGIFMQGGIVLMSFILLKVKNFSRVTVYSGILANGLDLLHILIGLILPAAGVVLISIGGIFYLIWFPMLSRDFFRLAKYNI